MKILITNKVLRKYTGTEVVVRDLALEFRKRSHEVWVYSPVIGSIAEEVRSNGVRVFDDIRKIDQVPDIIHGHHHAETLTALLRFSGVRAIFVCHDAIAWHDAPLIFPRVARYVAVDHRCKRRIESDPLVPPGKLRVILNAVDLSRFRQRPPLPTRPRRAAVFSNYASRWNYVPTVQEACKRANIALDIVGGQFGSATSNPEAVLPGYDLVFAKARCALEAMVVGCAVVLCDAPGLGVLVTSANVEDLRMLNFGRGTLTRPIEPDLVVREIDKYDSKDAKTVSDRMRDEAGLTDSVSEWLDLYEEVMNDGPVRSAHEDELAAIADYIRRWGYGARVEWEVEKARPFTDLPVVGSWLELKLKKI